MSMNAMESRDPAAAGGARRRLRSAAVAAALGALLTGGCGHPGAGRAPAAGPAPAPAAVPAQPAAAPPAGRAEALVRANETPPEQPTSAPEIEALSLNKMPTAAAVNKKRITPSSLACGTKRL